MSKNTKVSEIKFQRKAIEGKSYRMPIVKHFVYCFYKCKKFYIYKTTEYSKIRVTQSLGGRVCALNKAILNTILVLAVGPVIQFSLISRAAARRQDGLRN